MHYYCLTIRRTTPVKTYKSAQRVLGDYEYYINSIKLLHEGVHIEPFYETVLKKNGGINFHMHAMVKSPHRFSLHPKKGYSILFEECRTKSAWECYIKKDRRTGDQCLDYIDNILGDKSQVRGTLAPVPSTRSMLRKLFKI